MIRRLLSSLTLILVLTISVSELSQFSADAETAPVELPTVETSFSMPNAADDNDALLQQYINRVLAGQSGRKRRLAPKTGVAGAKLTGTDRKMYDLLRTEIEKVANGQRSSTEFTASAGELGLQMYTAAELGLTSLTEETESGARFTREAYDAVLQIADFDSNAVLSAILSDCPYDMYWYDKTYRDDVNEQYACEQSIGFRYDFNDNDELVFGISTIGISLRVATAYQKDGDPHLVDTTLPERVQNAAQNITQIVTTYANLGDTAKLNAYKTRICELTDYNQAAANNNNTPYGDPWQLIYVFDGDANTTVVCEGYSKAFKYLCDRSAFTGDIRCILATGILAGGTGSGGHMWNIVKMPNDKNYMVDVTNTDSGNGGLFLSGYSSRVSAQQYKYSSNRLTYTYNSGLSSTYDYDTWLAMSETDYIEIPVAVVLSDPGTETSVDMGTVICGYPLTLPECTFDEPLWHTFAGWQMRNDAAGTLYQPGESIRIMADTVFDAVWAISYPDMDSPDFILPQQIQTIGSEAFRGADPSVVKIPFIKGSQVIQDYAFAECHRLRQILIPASVTSIGEHVFDSCADGLMIFGTSGSAAQIYAENNNILFVPIEP